MANDNEGSVSEPKRIYYSIAGQLPDSAQRIVLEYLPYLEASVDDHVRRFGRTLAVDLKKRASEGFTGGSDVIELALDAIAIDKEVTVAHKAALCQRRRDLKRIRKSMNRLDEEIATLRKMQSNRCSLDRYLHVLDTQIVDFRLRRTQDGVTAAADCLRSFYDGWEPGMKNICTAIDDGLTSMLEELRGTISRVGRAATDDDEQCGDNEQKVATEVGSGLGHDGPASLVSLASEETRELDSDVAETPGDPAGDEFAEDALEATDEPQDSDLTAEDEQSNDVRSDEDQHGQGQGLASIDTVHYGEPSATTAPTEGTSENDAAPDYQLAKLANAMRCLANKKMDKQARASKKRVRSISRKCNKLLREQATALQDAREGVTASVSGIDNARAAVEKTKERVCRAIENGVAAARLD